MRIYDGSLVDVDVFDGNVLVGHILGPTEEFRCPFCGGKPEIKSPTSSKCGQCGAEHKLFSMTKRWYWERNVQGEVSSLKEKLRKRNRKVRSLRRELRKRS